MRAKIYINRHIVQANKKSRSDDPAISVNTYKGSLYAKKVVLPEGATLIQDTENAICSGATIWIECEFKGLIIDGLPASKAMYSNTFFQNKEKRQ